MPEFKKDKSKFQMKYSKGGFPFQSPLKDDKKAFNRELKKLNKVAEGTEESYPSYLSQEEIDKMSKDKKMTSLSKKYIDEIKSEKNDPTKSKSDYMEKRELTYDPSKHKL